MTVAHIPWTEIHLLHNVVRTYNYLLENDGLPLPTVTYRGKVKLHGTNCGIQVTSEGVFAQSRTQMLTLPSGDRKGFAQWVKDNDLYFSSLPGGTVLFGEWCGPGIEKKSAIAKHHHKIFAVFAVQNGNAAVRYDPEEILPILHDTAQQMPKEMHILPWYGEALALDYADKASLEVEIAKLNEVILAVEKEDPWVKEIFGLSGVGEGLVFYPIGEHASSDMERLGRTMFKAKGMKHAKVRVKKPVELDPEVVATIEGFVQHMVTDNRLEQAVTEACGGEASMRHAKAFLEWLTADVEKESEAELEAAGLEWDSLVQKAVQVKARAWLRGRVLSR